MLLQYRQSGMQVFCVDDCLVCRVKRNCLTRCHINTVVSPDDGPVAARNMYRMTNINILRKHLCTKLVYLQDYVEMHRHQNIEFNK